MNRVIPGLVIASLWLLLLLKGPFLLFWLLLILVAYLSGLEYTKMVFPEMVSKVWTVSFPILLSLPVVFSGFENTISMSGGLLISFLIIAVYLLFSYGKITDPFQLLSRAVFGLVYIGFLSAHLVLLHQLENGNLWIIILSAITAGSDTGAYYCGRLFGRRKLCPGISPKKTIEGAIGGVLGGLLCSLIFAWLLIPEFNILILAGITLVLVVFGIGGDLTESVIKRANKVKDSGKLLAGHGGVLDRADSILFAGPILYYFLLIL